MPLKVQKDPNTIPLGHITNGNPAVLLDGKFAGKIIEYCDDEGVRCENSMIRVIGMNHSFEYDPRIHCDWRCRLLEDGEILVYSK